MLSSAVQPPAQAEYFRDGNGSRSFVQGTQGALKGKARQQAVPDRQGRWPCCGQGRAQLQGDVPWNRLGPAGSLWGRIRASTAWVTLWQ